MKRGTLTDAFEEAANQWLRNRRKPLARHCTMPYMLRVTCPVELSVVLHAILHAQHASVNAVTSKPVSCSRSGCPAGMATMTFLVCEPRSMKTKGAPGLSTRATSAKY